MNMQARFEDVIYQYGARQFSNLAENLDSSVLPITSPNARSFFAHFSQLNESDRRAMAIALPKLKVVETQKGFARLAARGVGLREFPQLAWARGKVVTDDERALIKEIHAQFPDPARRPFTRISKDETFRRSQLLRRFRDSVKEQFSISTEEIVELGLLLELDTVENFRFFIMLDWDRTEQFAEYSFGITNHDRIPYGNTNPLVWLGIGIRTTIFHDLESYDSDFANFSEVLTAFCKELQGPAFIPVFHSEN